MMSRALWPAACLRRCYSFGGPFPPIPSQKTIRMTFKALHSVVAVVGIALASGGAWWLQNRQATAAAPGSAGGGATPSPASGPRAPGVEVAKVEVMPLRDDAQAVGTLRSRQNVVLRPEVAGRVSKLGFVEGTAVKKGQLLVQLDDTLQQAEIRQAQAQVSIASANLKRNQELVAQNFVAKRVLDESEAALQVAEAQLALAQARLARMSITAPFDGTVGLRSVNLGDYVKDGADLINLEDLSSLYVDFRLPERFQTRVKRGQEVEVQLDALPGRVFKARIEALDPLIDANGRSVAVRAVLPNTAGDPVLSSTVARGGVNAPAGVQATPVKPAVAKPLAPAGSGPLRPGMFARVTAVFAVRESALTVPEEAVVPQGGRQFVIKVVEPSAVPGTATASLSPEVKTVSLRTEVKLGIRRPGRVEVTEGVVEGDAVVVAGQQRLQKDGTAVRVLEAGRPGAGVQAAGPGAASAAGAAR